MSPVLEAPSFDAASVVVVVVPPSLVVAVAVVVAGLPVKSSPNCPSCQPRKGDNLA